uniref:Uncharacterized protein n=1 Tax=Rhizophora mucronata TaxID=61149 RepID=A0A2P2ITH0_RHIMU
MIVDVVCLENNNVPELEGPDSHGPTDLTGLSIIKRERKRNCK